MGCASTRMSRALSTESWRRWSASAWAARVRSLCSLRGGSTVPKSATGTTNSSPVGGRTLRNSAAATASSRASSRVRVPCSRKACWEYAA